MAVCYCSHSLSLISVCWPSQTLMTAEELIDMMGSAEELSEMNTTLMDVVLDRAR